MYLVFHYCINDIYIPVLLSHAHLFYTILLLSGTLVLFLLLLLMEDVFLWL